MAKFVLAVVVLLQCSARCSAAAIARDPRPWYSHAARTRTGRERAAQGSRLIAAVSSTPGGGDDRKVMHVPRYVIPDDSPVDPCVTCHPRRTTPFPIRSWPSVPPSAKKRFSGRTPAAAATKASRAAAVATKASRAAAAATKASRAAAVATKASRAAAVATKASLTAATITRYFVGGTGAGTRTRRETAARPVARIRRRVVAAASAAGGGGGGGGDNGIEVASDGGDDREDVYVPGYSAKMLGGRALERQGKLQNLHFERIPDHRKMKRADEYYVAHGSERLRKSKMRRGYDE